ncbi:helix-turn-helix transcriptional regulator [Cohnella hongkongensis]|uniref:Helix-turn-helix transcriptional regulator n=1 Tax=Cohnella hongkongensis TaxID=178337 RepID=A0ABV9FKQ7_9BACL
MTLYERPYLFQLMEAGNWGEMDKRMESVFRELSRFAHSAEHRMEVYGMFYSAFSHFAHRSGRLLLDVLGEELSPGCFPYVSAEQLQRWVLHAAQLLKEEPDRDQERCWDEIVSQVQTYVQEHLSEDVSLQTLADLVYLHPVYLSRLYRARTGERLIDYIIRIKMEHAAVRLKQGGGKIYEVARMVGYFSTSYFCKTFKKQFGCTPMEYRKRQTSVSV